MRRNHIQDKIESIEGCEVTVKGQHESAGQVYYEIGVIADDPQSAGEELEAFVDGSDWRVIVYENGGKPFYYDHDEEEEYASDIRVKKNLYNEHMI